MRKLTQLKRTIKKHKYLLYHPGIYSFFALICHSANIASNQNIYYYFIRLNMFKKYTLLLIFFIYSGLSIAESDKIIYHENGMGIVILQNRSINSLNEQTFKSSSPTKINEYVRGLTLGINQGFKKWGNEQRKNNPNYPKNLEYVFSPHKVINISNKKIIIIPSHLVKKQEANKTVTLASTMIITGFIKNDTASITCQLKGKNSISITSGPCAKAIKKVFDVTITSKDITNT